MAQWTNEAVGARARRSRRHLDRRRALDGADFAINTIEVGGIAATRLDFDDPGEVRAAPDDRRHVGRGRRLRALRTIPVMGGIADDMAELCPRRLDAQLHQPHGDELLGLVCGLAASPHRRPLPLDPEHEPADRRVRRRAARRDHLPRRRREPHELGAAASSTTGKSLYPALDAAIAADPEGLGRHVRVQIYKRFGFFPTESSEHFAEYVPWLMRDDAEIERLRIPVDEYIRRSEENLEFYAEEVRKLAAGEPFEIERSRRVRLADHPLDGHRAAAHGLRQRAQQRA